MISLKDLSPEDRNTLLQEARQQVEEEQTKLHAKEMYAIKKKELSTKTEAEIAEMISSHYSKKAGIKPWFDNSRFSNSYRPLFNYLYKVMLKVTKFSTTPAISTEEEWQKYELVTNNMKMLFEYTLGGKEIK